MPEPSIKIATRGSALALAQANTVLAECRRLFPHLAFELKIIKTSGDKLQTVFLSRVDASLPRGLFTKELEAALLKNQADLAVHSLKDLPTELPPGLKLGAVAGARADVRDVLIYRDAAHGGFKPKMKLADFPAGLTIATSSTRRKAQLLAIRPDFKAMEIRGNVATRLHKLAIQPEMGATILAAAGLSRLHFQITPAGKLKGAEVPEGLLAVILDVETMLPCVGQAALGLEIRENDERVAEICARLNHEATFQCVTAERAFLRAMGGGCQTPVGAYAHIKDGQLHMQAVSFLTGSAQKAEATGSPTAAATVGETVAARFSAK